jgi:hypothetical protein
MYNNIILSHESLNIWKMWCCLKERQQILSNIFQYLFDLQRIFKFASVSYSNYDFFPKFRECAGEWGLGRTPCQTERDAPNPSLKLERHVAETTALRPDKSTLGSSVRVWVGELVGQGLGRSGSLGSAGNERRRTAVMALRRGGGVSCERVKRSRQGGARWNVGRCRHDQSHAEWLSGTRGSTVAQAPASFCALLLCRGCTECWSEKIFLWWL